MVKIIIPQDILDYDTITLCDDGSVSNCTHPAGHCFGLDGGSGIPENLKVAPGRGGSFEVWRLNAQKTQIISQATYIRCQYCQKYNYENERT